jgi:hypothetical protein
MLKIIMPQLKQQLSDILLSVNSVDLPSYMEQKSINMFETKLCYTKGYTEICAQQACKT